MSTNGSRLSSSEIQLVLRLPVDREVRDVGAADLAGELVGVLLGEACA